MISYASLSAPLAERIRDRIAVQGLNYAALHVQSVDYEWSGAKWTVEDGWDHWTGDTCDKCGAIVVGQGESTQHRDVDSDSDCEGYVSLSAPMMSYYYPIEIDDRESAARAIAHLPLCVVEVNGTTGLALTGGGMNLQWEICEAFMCLGMLPPFHFADVPAMCGRGTSVRDLRILAACRASCEAMASSVESTLRRIDDARQFAIRYAQERKAAS